MNRDQYAQKQRWLQGDAGAIGALQTRSRRTGEYPAMAGPGRPPMARSGADERVAALLLRDGPAPVLPGDERQPITRHFSHHPSATPTQREAPPNP